MIFFINPSLLQINKHKMKNGLFAVPFDSAQDTAHC